MPIKHTTISEEVAFSLLNISAVRLSPSSPFKWASGWNSPIYCDNRLTLSFPEVRTLIKNSLINNIKKEFPQVEAIAGVATAGIPQASLIANDMGLPLIYVRPKHKEHGMGNQIEGLVVPKQKVVVIEDLISTGGSSLKAVEALQNTGIEVLGMVAIFTYGFEIAAENFRKSGVKLITLSDYSTLIQVGLSSNFIQKEDIDSLENWRNNPAEWTK
ncbi:MAG: orotate phosphoribosyltransferase [Cytophagales bacterium]|nr:MAG: orotate phosphoribosyltransferase [Cytophagales bacterium]